MTIPPAERGERDAGTPAEPPLDGFAPEEFTARRDALRAACPDGLILLRGATEDQAVAPGTYRQNSHFFYLTGVDTPGALLVLLPEGLPASSGLRDLPPAAREVLFLPGRSPYVETWTGPKLVPGEALQQATGIEKAVDANGIWNALTGWLRRNPLVYTVMPYGEQAKTTREYALMQRIGDVAPVAQFRDVALALARLRAVKSSAEIERIRQAVAITAEGHRVARAFLAEGAGRWEYEVEAQIYAAFRSRGARSAFAPIVGAGPNGTVLHYEDNHSRMQAGELVVVDIGARFGHYCGDLTRTYSVGGKFTPRQREVYALVREAHAQTLSGFRLGEDTLKSLSDRCKAFLKASPLRARDGEGREQTMDTFMPHGLSHHLGLDVHDSGDPELPLAPGSVITVEPGLYLPSEGFGVRLEDDYLVCATGLERLGPPLDYESL